MRNLYGAEEPILKLERGPRLARLGQGMLEIPVARRAPLEGVYLGLTPQMMERESWLERLLMWLWEARLWVLESARYAVGGR